MKVTDYIVNFLVEQGVKDVFGYQGTMIAHFVDSIYRNKNIRNHVSYHEQGAAFAAVGYAKASGKVGVAYSTSGPGAVNLMSGIADAYFDSVPTIFITGQLNLYEYTDIPTLRQQGFQQIDVISSVKKFTKYCIQVRRKEDIRYILEKAFYISHNDRKGPVVIDIPMNIQRENVNPQSLKGFTVAQTATRDDEYNKAAIEIIQKLKQANRPIILLGNGIQKK